MYKECRNILPDGSRCHAVALKDAAYCYHHDRIHRALRTGNNHQQPATVRL